MGSDIHRRTDRDIHGCRVKRKCCCDGLLGYDLCWNLGGNVKMAFDGFLGTNGKISMEKGASDLDKYKFNLMRQFA